MSEFLKDQLINIICKAHYLKSKCSMRIQNNSRGTTNYEKRKIILCLYAFW